MKINLALICATIPTATCFIVAPVAVRQLGTSLSLSNENDYLGALREGLQNTNAPSKPPLPSQNEERPENLEDRLEKLDRVEKVLDHRLDSLARKEKVLEDRLTSLSQTERNIDERMMRDERRVRGASDQRRFDTERNGGFYGSSYSRYGNDFDRYGSGRGTWNRRSRDRPQSSPAVSQFVKSINEIWENSNPTTVQGGSLRTWAFLNPAVRRVHVLLKTDGRPLDADVELWNGPDNTPHKMKVYVEDGGLRTFSTFIETPRSPNTVCIKNTGQLEFPLYGVVGVDRDAGDQFLESIRRGRGEIIQGGAIRTYAFDPYVDSVAVMIRTDGRPLNARIELLQGPNNNKQVLAVYTEDGLDRPFMAVIQTPGSGNVVRVVNTAPVEFPIHTTVVEHETGGYSNSGDPYWNDGIQIGSQW